jgi:hypothetical protein
MLLVSLLLLLLPTTRKSANTKGITYEIFLSIIFTDGHNSVSNFIGIYRQTFIVGNNYRRNRIWGQYGRYIPTVLPIEYIDFWKVATVWLRDSNRDLRTMTWHIHWRTYRRDMSVSDSIGKSQYIPTLPTLSPSISPSSSSSQLSPPKLQLTTHPNSPPLLNTSTQVSYTFIRGHNIRSLSNLLWILSFFVSKSIIFSFNI